MLRYLLIGLFFAFFWCFIEPHLYNLIFFIRYNLLFGAKVKRNPRAQDAGPFENFWTGCLAALILAFWPIYLIAFTTKFLSLIFGSERLEHT